MADPRPETPPKYLPLTQIASHGNDAHPECAWCEPSERCAPEDRCGTDVRRIALLGNPNTGKTTLFNRISGLRHKTSNFPGTTLEARVTRVKAGAEGGRDGDLIDLPGIYSLELDQLESRVCREVLAVVGPEREELLVVDGGDDLRQQHGVGSVGVLIVGRPE